MNTDAIAIDDRFSDFELFDMFNVEICPDIDAVHGDKRRPSDVPYAFNDIKVHLWGRKKRRLSRGERKALQSEDKIKPGITDQAPGSSRVADLAKFYAQQSAGIGPQGEVVYTEASKSPFCDKA